MGAVKTGPNAVLPLFRSIGGFKLFFTEPVKVTAGGVQV
jgi:hypothetical protein